MNKQLLTQKGRKKVEEERTHLKQQKRPEIIQAIATARAMGDLSENADYHAAKDQQGLIESKIKDLENLLATGETPDSKHIDQDKIAFGAKVSLLDVQTKQRFVYELVGVYEADLKQQLISFYSPLGKSLVGKRRGEITQVELPNGSFKIYEILDIAYPEE
jgi:transcription elongation factor GreA